MSNKLIDQISEEFVAKAIRTFYERAFVDPMICHFFMNSDIDHISTQQTKFAIAMLGGPKNYDGPHLDKAHERFDIRPPHFGRRQILMREVDEGPAKRFLTRLPASFSSTGDVRPLQSISNTRSGT